MSLRLLAPFRSPLADGQGTWSEPYFDEGGGNTHMVTYSALIQRGGEISVIATVDIPIADLVEKLRALSAAQNDYACPLSAGGG